MDKAPSKLPLDYCFRSKKRLSPWRGGLKSIESQNVYIFIGCCRGCRSDSRSPGAQTNQNRLPRGFLQSSSYLGSEGCGLIQKTGPRRGGDLLSRRANGDAGV